MSTKTQTNQSSSSALSYDPQSLNLYHSLTGASGKALTGYINSPFNNPFYRLGLQQSIRGATQAGANNMNMLQQNMKASGLTGQAGAGFLQAQQAQTGRANQSLLSQANLSNVMAAYQRQLGAAGMGMSYSPLMTGESSQGQSTQTKSGLGTWLPQVLGAAASGLMAAGTGGASLAFGGMSPGAISGSFGGPTSVPMDMTNNFSPVNTAGLGDFSSNPFAASMMPSAGMDPLAATGFGAPSTSPYGF